MKKPIIHSIWAYVEVKKVRSVNNFTATLRVHTTDSKQKKAIILNDSDLGELKRKVSKAFYDFTQNETAKIGHPFSNCETKNKNYRGYEFPTYIQCRILNRQVTDFPNMLEVRELLDKNKIPCRLADYNATVNTRYSCFEKTKVLLVDGVLCQFATVVIQTLISMGRNDLAKLVTDERVNNHE